jgi:hypothetical protein
MAYPLGECRTTPAGSSLATDGVRFLVHFACKINPGVDPYDVSMPSSTLLAYKSEPYKTSKGRRATSLEVGTALARFDGHF